MSHRYFVFRVVGPLAAAIAILSLAPALIARQAASVATRTTQTDTRTSFRAPWGEPDLQGIWSVAWDVPLERPSIYAGREFLTDKEVAEIDKKKAEDPGRNVPAAEGDVGTYNAVFNSVLRTGKRTSMIVDPPDGKIPPLTPLGQKRQPPAPGSAAPILDLGPEDRGIMTRCLGIEMPAFGDRPADAIFAQTTIMRIVQSPGVVAIYHENNHKGAANRIIPVDGSPHLPSHLRFWLGDQRGRWEGATLVVDTTNLTNRTDFRGSNENLHVIERYTRVDAKTIQRQITMDDPTIWTRPWTVMIELGKTDDKLNQIYESACHEGNYAILGALAGKRAQEKAAAAEAGRQSR